MKNFIKYFFGFFGWLVVFICLFVNIFLLFMAMELPILSEADAVLADMGLFFAVIFFGIPASVMSTILIAIILFIKKWGWGLISMGIISFFNIVMPFGILYWLLMVLKS